MITTDVGRSTACVQSRFTCPTASVQRCCGLYPDEHCGRCGQCPGWHEIDCEDSPGN
jgi:hypothetical protein